MTTLVPGDQIEAIVGERRHPALHYGRADTTQGVVFILHSQRCVDTGVDLRECPYSVALDGGIDTARWDGHMDRPVTLTMDHGKLLPAAVVFG